MHAHRVPHGAIVAFREVLHEMLAQRVERTRRFAEEFARDRGERRDVLLPCDRHRARIEHRLDWDPPREEVLRRDEMDRPAHQRRAHDLTLRGQPPQLLGRELLQPRPQPDERRLRDLRLHPREARNSVERRDALALQQQLPREGGAVEGAVRELHGWMVKQRAHDARAQGSAFRPERSASIGRLHGR
jgi:hypothetical protein